jgi:hypothetical protein
MKSKSKREEDRTEERVGNKRVHTLKNKKEKGRRCK